VADQALDPLNPDVTPIRGPVPLRAGGVGQAGRDPTKTQLRRPIPAGWALLKYPTDGHR
jgi:hypothetical protein